MPSPPTREALLALLDDLAGARVAVIGDHGLDAVWEIEPENGEASWETGLPTRVVRSERYDPAGASNVAAGVAALGASDVRAIGVRGDDPFGRELARQLAARGVDTGALLVDSSARTLVYAKSWIGEREDTRHDFGVGNAVAEETTAVLCDAVRAALLDGCVVVANQQVLGGLLWEERVDAFRAAVAGFADRILVDTRHQAARFTGLTIKMNKREAKAFLGPDWSADRAADALAIRRRTGRPAIITLGGEGAAVADEEGALVLPPILYDGPVDPVGCGDTFIATLAAALSVGARLATAAALANAAATVTAGVLRCTGAPSCEDVYGLLTRY